MSYSIKQLSDYRKKKMQIFPIEKGSKGGSCNPEGWQNLEIDDLEKFKDRNCCWVLKDFTDIDLDYPLAIPIAKEILPPTGMIAGRLSNPSSHYFYKAEGMKSEDFVFRGKKLLQIRNGDKYQLIGKCNLVYFSVQKNKNVCVLKCVSTLNFVIGTSCKDAVSTIHTM